MLRSEAILEIKRGLGFRQTQDTTIIAALKQAQRTLELGRTLPSFLRATGTSIVTADQESIALPERFIRFNEDIAPFWLNSDGAKVFLAVRRYDEAYAAYVANGTEDAIPATDYEYPQTIVLINKELASLLPVPTTSFTLYINYYKGAVVLDAEVENTWLEFAPDVLIGMAGASVAGSIRDRDGMAAFAARRDMGLRGLLGDIVEDELAGRPLVMGRNK